MDPLPEENSQPTPTEEGYLSSGPQIQLLPPGTQRKLTVKGASDDSSRASIMYTGYLLWRLQGAGTYLCQKGA